MESRPFLLPSNGPGYEANTYTPLSLLTHSPTHSLTHSLTPTLVHIISPESVPRLFDLVRPKDPLFLSAFYFALRNTLVASDLDQATRIGLQGRTRHRVVTLGGQLIDTSGGGCLLFTCLYTCVCVYIHISVCLCTCVCVYISARVKRFA